MESEAFTSCHGAEKISKQPCLGMAPQSCSSSCIWEMWASRPPTMRGSSACSWGGMCIPSAGHGMRLGIRPLGGAAGDGVAVSTVIVPTCYWGGSMRYAYKTISLVQPEVVNECWPLSWNRGFEISYIHNFRRRKMSPGTKINLLFIKKKNCVSECPCFRNDTLFIRSCFQNQRLQTALSSCFPWEPIYMTGSVRKWSNPAFN